MKRELLGLVSALALTAGAAWAQDAATTPAQPSDQTAPTVMPTPGADPSANMTQEPGTGPATDTAQNPPAATPPADTAQTPPAAAPSTDTAQTPPAAEPSTDTAQTPPAATGATDTAAAEGEPVSADDMMGRSVAGSDGEDLGEVSDVVVDSETGKIQQLIVASGGFLGIGDKTVAIAFEEVEIRPEGGIVAQNLTQQDIEGLPEYDVSTEVKSLDEPAPAMPATGAGPAAPMGSAGGGAGGGAGSGMGQ
jgi:sporulation protein YlmC with PRC-barrel domain